MVRLLVSIAVFFAFAAIVSAAAPGGEQSRFKFRGTVYAVIDGDTMRVHLANGRRERVRLVGVEAPKGSECFAARATARMRKLALRKRVTLQGDAQQSLRDGQGRLLAYVALPRNTDLTSTLLRGGYVRQVEVGIEKFSEYLELGYNAHKAKRGQWGACPSDVAVSVTDAPDPVAAGQPITYTVVVANRGTGPSLPAYVDVSFVDYESDPPVRVLSATATSGWTCQDQTEYVTCGLGFFDTLEPKASVMATIIVIPSLPGVLRVRATSGDEIDKNPQDDSADAITTVTAAQ